MTDIQKILNGISLPIIEIGGPTPEGSELINSLKLKLPYSPKVTNIRKKVVHNPYGSTPTVFEVDEVVDVRSMPYPDNSIGMVIACSLPLTPDQSQGKHSKPKYKDRKVGLLAYKQFLDGGSDLKAIINANLHIALFIESIRVLQKGGLLLIESGRPEDLAVGRKLKFKNIYMQEVSKGQDYRLIFQT